VFVGFPIVFIFSVGYLRRMYSEAQVKKISTGMKVSTNSYIVKRLELDYRVHALCKLLLPIYLLYRYVG
jgi:hypothetical protein